MGRSRLSRGLPAVLLFALVTTLALLAAAAPDDTPEGVYDFERAGPGRPDPWGGGPAATLSPDTTIVHGGRQSVRLHREADSPGSFSTATLHLPGDRAGAMIELRGWLRSEDVDQWFGLWLRLDGPSGPVGFDNMQRRGLRGTTDWTEYRITMALSPETRQVYFGALVSGPGTLWADDLSVRIDGKPWAEAPVVVAEPTVLETDTEFATSSGCDLTDPSPIQSDNLALLGRVWGFLKYHHPAVTDGSRHWDFELFRILPAVIAAKDHDTVCDVLEGWVRSLGPIAPCDPCAEPPVDPAQAAPLAWLTDTDQLGPDLAARLQAVHAARPADGESFWVDFMPQVGNPVFDREPSYANLARVDAGYRLLALFRCWNIIEYWSPNRDIIGEDWPAVLREFVPRLLGATGTEPDAFGLGLLALVARINDTHTQLYGAWAVRPPGMAGAVPVRMRWVEQRPVVAGWLHEFSGPATGLQIGDVIVAVDGSPVDELFAAWRPYYAASNEMQRLDDLAAALMRGPVGPCTLRVRRGGDEVELTPTRLAYADLDLTNGRWHTIPGPCFRLLDEGVAYLALDTIKSDSVQTWIEQALAADARGLVIDCRAYPGDFPIFELGGHLVGEPTPFVTFTRADPANPGAFLWTEYTPLTPIAPHFDRPVVVLVDETSQSSAEYHALAFRAAPQAIVMGGTSSGADGNVSRFVLPGNLTTMISGIGVFDAERNPTQRVGIVPDVPAEPTVAGLMAGRDEVLAAAVANILDRSDRRP